MANVSKDDSNIKVGLILVKSEVTEKGVCFSSFSSSENISCKCSDKWIVVAGNNYSVKQKKDDKELKSESEETSKKLFNIAQNPASLKKCSLLDQPLFQHNVVEMHLDSVFKDKATKLSAELFMCVNVRVLSLRNNNLTSLPADIGRLSQLKTLVLTDNCLTVSNIPYTLIFCQRLTELYLDHNFLDALPGYLLEMPQLETVYRHGNDNYFKTTFMWYHTSERDRYKLTRKGCIVYYIFRVMPLAPNRVNKKSEGELFQPHSLESHAIKSLVEAKINFFTPGLLPVTLQEHVAKVYKNYKICAFCGTVFDESKSGFRVFTFKSPYVGNTCVPLAHWTCSQACGVALEKPAHRQERIQAKKMDKQYEQYIRSVKDHFYKKPPDKKHTTCLLM